MLRPFAYRRLRLKEMTIITWTRFLFILCLLICDVAAEWSGQEDYDDEQETECNPVSKFNHGKVHQRKQQGEGKVSGTVLEYKCYAPYKLKGPSSRRCNSDGQWEGEAPVCYLPTCPQIEYSFHNGEIIYTDDLRSVGVSAFFVCHKTFDLFPSAQMEIICQSNGEWDLKEEDFPDCLQRAAVPHVKDGKVYRYAPYRGGQQRPGFDARHNQSIVVQCDPDRRAFRDVYLDNEDDRVSTNNNGTWVPKIAECVPEPCDVRGVLSDHVMSYENGSIVGWLIPHGETVTIYCMDDHELTSQTPFVKRKCSYGKMRIPQCFPKSCSEPSRTSNPYLHFSDGFNIGPWFEHGVKAVASCHPRTDYEVFVDTTNEFTDSYITTCNFGNWSVIHGCVERHCVLPMSSDIIFEPSVYYNRTDGEVVASGTTINMSCTEGYTLTDEHLYSYHHSIPNKCYKGKWNLTVSCEPDPCHLPDLQDGFVFIENTESQNVAHAAVITMSCKPGYQMYFGTRQVQADQVGVICWLGVLINLLNNDTSLPECRPMACQLNNKPGTSFYVNGREVPGETTVASDTRFYVVCHDGFRRVDEFGHKTSINSTICVLGRLSNGINCQEIECSLSSANNTMTDTNIVSPGRQVNVVCSPGFEMRVGGSFFESHRFLCKKGTFQPTFPVCVEKQCEVISTEFTRHNPDNRSVPSKSSVTISCLDDYELHDGSRYVNLEEMNMTCSRGKFDISPVCKPKRCQLPDDNTTLFWNPNGRLVDHKNVQSGKMVKATCRPGFNLVSGHSDLWCINGQWVPNWRCKPDNPTTTDTSVYLLVLNTSPQSTPSLAESTSEVTQSTAVTSSSVATMLPSKPISTTGTIISKTLRKQSTTTTTTEILATTVTSLKSPSTAVLATTHAVGSLKQNPTKTQVTPKTEARPTVTLATTMTEIPLPNIANKTETLPTIIATTVTETLPIIITETLTNKMLATSIGKAQQTTTSTKATLISTATETTITATPTINNTGLLDDIDPDISDSNETPKFEGCRIPDGYSIRMMNEVNVDRKVRVNDTATIQCDVSYDYGFDSMINITCLEHGKFDRDLDPCKDKTEARRTVTLATTMTEIPLPKIATKTETLPTIIATTITETLPIIITETLTNKMLTTSIGKAQQTTTSTKATLISTATETTITATPTINNTGLLDDIDPDISDSNETPKFEGCRIPDGYSILMMNEVNVDRQVQVNDTATIQCNVYYDYGFDSIINITCLEHGKFDRDLDPCQVQTVDCPQLDHGTVNVFAPGKYSLVCEKKYRLSKKECQFTGCSNQSFTCGNVICEPQNCKLKASAGTLSNNELKKKETIELAHNSSIIVGCDEGLEPTAVLYTCSFGYISGNSTEYPTKSGKMPQCRKAVCDLCNNGECIRDATCRCFHGNDGPNCDPVLLCEPLCLENGGQCTITGQCLCSTGRTGANCELVEYRIALERGSSAGTFDTIWIEVIGARDSFKQELTGVYNTFGKSLKLRYTLKGIYVGEISNVLITTSQSVVLNVGYVAIYSFEDRTYYRFEAGNKRRSVCWFERRDGTPWTYGYNTKPLRSAENAEECQLSCVGERGCVLAQFDKRTTITTSSALTHPCFAFLWGFNMNTTQTAGVEVYVKYCK